MPGFSIVIPTFNRPRQLESCIESIGAMPDAKESVEVIIVNDGGQPPDPQRLQERSGGVTVHLRNQSRLGAGAARNNGAFHADGDHIVFVDDDCLLPADWASNARTSVERNPGAMIGGLTINVLSDNIFAEASQTLVDYVSAYYNDPVKKRTPLFTSNNIIVPAAMFRQFGGFDESFRAAEDRELCRRWHRRRLPMIRDESVVVLHAHRLGFGSIIRQHFTYGRGAFPYWHEESPRLRTLRVEPLSFYSGMLVYPIRANRRRALALSALIILTQVANAAGFAREAAARIRPARAPRPYFKPGPL